MEITKFELWKDTGFTEGGINVPKPGAELSNPDITISTPMHPSWSDIFATVKVREADGNTPLTYLDLYEMSYCRATLTYDDEREQILYGWVEGVECRSDSDTPMNIIKWKIDYWRTYANLADFRYGIVRRSDIYNMAQGFEPMHWVMESNKSMLPPAKITLSSHEYDLWWVYFTMTIQDASGDTVSNRRCCFPVVLNADGTGAFNVVPIKSPFGYPGWNSSSGISFNSVIRGTFDEYLKINPATVNYVGICQIPPCPYAYDTTDPRGLYFIDDQGNPSTSWIVRKEAEANYGYFADDPGGTSANYEQCFREIQCAQDSIPVSADDFHRIYIVGYDNEPVGEIPFGYAFDAMYARVVLNQTAGYVQIRHRSTVSEVAAHAEGMCFTVPMIGITLSENSLSEYVYSGQQEYDRESLHLANQKAFASGIIGGTNYGAQNGIYATREGMGGVMNEMGIGAVAGAVTSVIGSVASYAINELYFDEQQMEIKTRAKARQTDNLLLPGQNPPDSIFKCGGGMRVIVMKMDPVSEDRFEKMVDAMGYTTALALMGNDLNAMFNGTHDILQIDQLEVGGPIPPRAKQYISELLGRGVRLV